MAVREMRQDDLPRVREMMGALCPGEDAYDFSHETVFVWDDGSGCPVAFISVSIREWANGCDSNPVPYIEGWWVAPELRNRGVARSLLRAAERWCRDHGHSELGSDAELHNGISLRVHEALGFEPTLRLQHFRKHLST
jgi:aminoglycoside 6'-N-acetyltransferase I